MSRWFRFYDDAINDPTLQRLSGDKFKLWVNLPCIASKHNGVLPPLTDLCFLLRIGEDKISALLDDFSDKGLLDPVDGEPMTYAPHKWSERQYADGSAAERAKRYRSRKRDGHGGVTCDGRNDGSRVTALEQNREEKNRGSAVTGDGGRLLEITDEQALEAWDEYGRQTTGKTFPRNRRGGARTRGREPRGADRKAFLNLRRRSATWRRLRPRSLFVDDPLLWKCG